MFYPFLIFYVINFSSVFVRLRCFSTLETMLCLPKISDSILLMKLSQDSLCVLETIVLAIFLFILYVSKFSSLRYFWEAVHLISMAFLISSFQIFRPFFGLYFFFVPVALLAAFCIAIFMFSHSLSIVEALGYSLRFQTHLPICCVASICLIG